MLVIYKREFQTIDTGFVVQGHVYVSFFQIQLENSITTYFKRCTQFIPLLCIH